MGGSGPCPASVASPTPHTQTYLALAVLLDELVDRVAVGDPTDEARVVRQRHDRVALNAEVELGRVPVAREKGVHQPEQLHHSLVLPQVFATLEQEQVRSPVSW